MITIIGTPIQRTLPIIKNIHRLRIDVWSLSITVVSQRMPTVLTSSLAQARNVSPLLLSVSRETLKMFVQGLKHAVNQRIKLQ